MAWLSLLCLSVSLEMLSRREGSAGGGGSVSESTGITQSRGTNQDRGDLANVEIWTYTGLGNVGGKRAPTSQQNLSLPRGIPDRPGVRSLHPSSPTKVDPTFFYFRLSPPVEGQGDGREGTVNCLSLFAI